MASPYANSSSGGSAYAQANTGGSSYAGGNTAARRGPAKSSGHGGILGGLEGAAHWVASKAERGATDIKSIPSGLIQTGRFAASPFVAAYDRATGNSKGADKQIAFAHQFEHGIVGQTKHAAAHPLADPIQTALLFAPFLHGTGSAVARGTAAAEAARAGEGVAGAVKAAAKVPEVKPRLLKIGGSEEPLQPSKNPGVRLIQSGYDKVLQKSIDENPGGKIASHATRRIGGAQDETARYQQRMREAPAGALDQAAKKLTSKTHPAEGRLRQAALELTSVNTTPEDAASYHLAQAEKGVDVARNNVVAKLYKTVDEKGLLTTNEHGDVIVNAADHPKLAKADLALAKVQGRGDEILSRYGIRNPEDLQNAVNSPGRYRAGARYEAPTPGKAGISPALDAATVERDRIAALHERALNREEKWHAERQNKDLGALSEQDATGRLAALDKQYDAQVHKLIPDTSQFGGKVSQAEQLRRNKENAKAGKGNRIGAKKQPLVSSEEYKTAEDKLLSTIEKNPGNSTAEGLANLVAERNRLRQALNARAENAMVGGEETPLPSAPAKAHLSVPTGSNPHRNLIVQLGTRLEAAQAKVDRLQAAAERRVKPTGVIGGETARPGRGHVSYASSEKRAPASPAAASPGPVIGEAKSPITSHANTGYNIEHGLVPKDVTGAASRHFRQITRFVNTTERRNAAIRTGSDVRRSERDVLVKQPGEDHAKLSRAIEEAIGREKPTVDQMNGLNAALDHYRETLVPGVADKFAADSEHPIGTPAADAAAARGLDAPEGYKWVDRNVLGDLAKARPGARGRIAKTADNINSAVTAATVYLKVGHIGTRLLTNAATNIVQGSAKPQVIARSAELWHQLSGEDRLRALAASGQHGYSALPHEGTGAIARTATKGANWWAKHVDAPFRFNSIAYEARKAGYDTPTKFTGFLDKLENPQAHNLSATEAAKVDAVAKRANREGIAYDRLNNLERNYITRAFWFYPWTAGATRFAVNTALEHPYKAAGLGAAGAQGSAKQARDLGELPSYEGGLFNVGAPNAAGQPLVADFSTFSPFATTGDVLNAAGRPKQISGFLNPVYSGINSLINGVTSTGTPTKKPLETALQTVTSPLPEAQVIAALLSHANQSKKMFPTSPLQTFLRTIVGPGLPRRLNVQVAHKDAGLEKTGR